MKILMVCLGNICRSPMAEGVLRHLAKERGMQLTVDSAGTANYHVGDAPDRRARAAAMKRQGMNIEALRGRQVEAGDFHRFELLLAMDRNNFNDLIAIAPDEAARSKVKLMMDHAPGAGTDEVPDPYYGSEQDFDHVFQLLKEACSNLIDQLHERR